MVISTVFTGIPETSGRLKFSLQGTKVNVTHDWNSMYKMNSDPRGYCIIINNRHFTGRCTIDMRMYT